MTNLAFKGKELKSFIDKTLNNGVNSNHLQIEFWEEITVKNLTQSILCPRAAIQDHLENHNIARDSGFERLSETIFVFYLLQQLLCRRKWLTCLCEVVVFKCLTHI